MRMRTPARSLASKGRTGTNLALVSPAPIQRICNRERRAIIQVRGLEIMLEGYN